MKNILRITMLVILFTVNKGLQAQDYSYTSPDGKLELIINTDAGLKWSLKH